MGKAELEAALNTLDIWLIIFGVLVAIGAVGGSVAGFLHWRRSGQLQELQRAEILQLQSNVSDAQARAANAQLELEKYKAPRTLSAAQQTAFVEALKGHAGQQYALSVGSGQEPQNLLCLLDRLLTNAGWHQTQLPPTIVVITANTDCGATGVNTLSNVHVRIAVNALDVTVASASALNAALNSAGIVSYPERDPVNVPVPTVILLMVGVKS